MNRRIRLVKPIRVVDAAGPSMEELAAIDREWPVIAAELAVVDAEIRLARATGPAQLERVRLRRARAQLAQLRAETTGTRCDSPRGRHGDAA